MTVADLLASWLDFGSTSWTPKTLSVYESAADHIRGKAPVKRVTEDIGPGRFGQQRTGRVLTYASAGRVGGGGPR